LDLGEDLIPLVCLVLNAIALVRCRKSENLDEMNVGWLGVFIAPTTKSGRWEAVLSHGAPDSQPRHPTVRVRPLELLSSGPPDSPVVHRTGPVDCPVRLLAPTLTSARAGAHCSALNAFCRRPLARSSRCSAGAPDSPVVHRTVR
jgi:hypothetical protein